MTTWSDIERKLDAALARADAESAVVRPSTKDPKKPWSVQYRSHFWYFKTEAEAKQFAERQGVTRTDADKSWVKVSQSTYDGMVVGKLYAFDGRKGRVLEKSETSGQKSAVGLQTSGPMVRVEWK